ncbi:MAG: hypothetical protein DRI57_22260 [Deltaproteobacteria bacterium]|nr:MAG: hypothetical protein DRI57_22260 [Deltaproteobacteria bacterium]
MLSAFKSYFYLNNINGSGFQHFSEKSLCLSSLNDIRKAYSLIMTDSGAAVPAACEAVFRLTLRETGDFREDRYVRPAASFYGSVVSGGCESVIISTF